MGLEEQVLTRSKEISTDAYSMSAGELISLYRDGELDIHPEFQRFFRWTTGQKSRFIESLLLGIPVPSFFVSQKKNGSWDVVDGLQRLSTIFQLTGDLRGEEDTRVDPLVLEKTTYLPDLEGKSWESDSPDRELPQSAKLKIKRARLDLKIVMNTSDEGRIPDFPVTRSHPPASWPSAANSSICRTYRKTAGEESRRRSPVANRWMRP